MKSRLFSLIAMISASISAFACEDIKRGPYVGLLAGINFLDYDDPYYDIDMESGYLFGGFAGYRFCNGIRLEGEVDFRRNNIEDFVREEQSFEIGGHGEVTTLMANAIYDLDMGSLWTPYGGLGIGYAHVEFKTDGYNLTTIDKYDHFTWQAILGVSYSLMCDTDVALEYRFLQVSSHWQNNSVGISLKRFF